MLRKAGFTYLEILAVGPMPINPPQVFALIATGQDKQYHVFFPADADPLHPRWKNPNHLLNHVRAKLNKAALRLHKQWREADRKYWIAYWVSPEGIAERERINKEMREVHLPAMSAVITDYVNQSAVTYRRYANPLSIPSIRQDQLQPRQRMLGKSKYF